MILRGKQSSSGSVVILCGAGLSVRAGIPPVVEFATKFTSHIGRPEEARKELAVALEEITAAWNAMESRRVLDLEVLYEVLAWINEREARPAIPLALAASSKSPFPSRSRATENLLWELQKYIQSRCLSFGPVDYLQPICQFAKCFPGLTILTLNYDICLESVLDAGGVAWTDGFPKSRGAEWPWHQLTWPSAGQRSRGEVELLKLHGSASWYSRSPGKMVRGRGRSLHEVGLRFGATRSMTGEAAMIYPSLSKALGHGPFPGLFARAQRALSRARLCLVLGYSFGDPHIRSLVLSILAERRELAIVLVDPRAEAIRQQLLDDDLAKRCWDRIGLVEAEKSDDGEVERGKAEIALRGDWLLHRTEAWLRSGDVPGALKKPLAGGKLSGGVDGANWQVRYAIRGGAGRLAWAGRSILFFGRLTRKLCVLDTVTGESRVTRPRFSAPAGVAHDSESGEVFVVDKGYRLSLGRLGLRLGRVGPGRVWRKRGIWARSRPLTGAPLRTKAKMLGWRLGWMTAPDGEALWRDLVGVLRWPTSVLVESSGKSILVTEAKRLVRIDVQTAQISSLLVPALCENLVDLAWEGPASLFLVDGGIHSLGRGRLMRGSLESGEVDVLAGGWEFTTSVAYLPQKRLVLVAFGGSWPDGEVQALDVDHGFRPTHRWLQLDDPVGVLPLEGDEGALVGTRGGIVELEF